MKKQEILAPIKKLVLHFDITNTIVFFDPTSGRSTDDIVNQ